MVAMAPDPFALARSLDRYDPSLRPIHCSNCLHAKVSGRSDDPTVTCAHGFGKPLPLITMLRAQAPRQFIPAAKCPRFTRMDDDG